MQSSSIKSLKRYLYVVYQNLLIILLIWITMLTFEFPKLSSVNGLLMGATLLIIMLGLSLGLIVSMGACLAILFLFGTILFWNAFVSTSLLLPVMETVYWMFTFILSAVLSGLFQRWISTILAENKEMNEQFEQLVTIDKATGFDNGKRLLFELQGECSRAYRTKVPFSLVLIKIMYFDQFQRLYGTKETLHLLATRAQLLMEQTRINDRKFRFSEDTFALILPNTVGDNVDLVIGKIESLFKHHQLMNKQKEISLTIAFGKASYHEQIHDYMELMEHAQDELQHYVQ